MDLVDYVASVQRQDYRHSRFPLGDLVRALRDIPDIGDAPLYEIAFNYQKLDFRLTIHSQVVETHYLSHSHERVPLTFVLCDYGQDQDVRLHIDYVTSYFHEGEVNALLDRLLHLLRQVAADSSRRIDEYHLLTEAEWHRQFSTWQGATLPLREKACIHDFFEEQVLRTPESIALTCGNASLSYAALNEYANRLAHRLIEQGVRRGSLIGICHNRSVYLPVAMLAVLKSGAAYVPIDPAYPLARVRYILDDARLDLIITDTQSALLLGERDCTVINTDDLFNGEASIGGTQGNPTHPLTELSAEDLAYVIYTSGSTGQPKGVLIEHKSATSFIQWALEHFSTDELSSVLASTSICFDLSIFELFVTLSAGGRVVLVENALALKDNQAQGLSLINTVPSAIRSMLDAGAIPASVQCINLAGEPLRQELVDDLYAQLGQIKVHDLYGPSESTTYSTCSLRTRGGDTSIGRPIANTLVYILDDAGNPLPTGSVGELHIGGPGLSRGYLGKPAPTAEKFISNAHAATRLYRTGDMVRFLDDGRLQYVARKDNQLKIRGHRIEPGEIEACLLEHPQITDCVVVAKAHAARVDGTYLVAYLAQAPSLGEGGHVSGNLFLKELAAFVAERLPSFMVPAQFVVLPALPLTPNGKVDRNSLPDPDHAARSQDDYVPPNNELEIKLCELWQSTLKRERIGIHDNFFAHGGDSLLLVKLASLIEGEFRLSVNLPLLFASPTIEAQGRMLAQQLELSQLLQAVGKATETRTQNYFVL